MPAPKGHEPYNKNGEGGRPIKYTQEFIEQEAKELENWMKQKDHIFIEEFAFERGYDERRINEWVEVNEKFSLAYYKLKNKQKFALYKGGLDRSFAHPMCALILGHAHGIVAKTEQKLSGNASDPLLFILELADGSSKDLVE